MEILQTIKMLHWCINHGLSPTSLKWSRTNQKYQWHFHTGVGLLILSTVQEFYFRIAFSNFFYFPDQSMDVVNLGFKRLFSHTYTHTHICFPLKSVLFPRPTQIPVHSSLVCQAFILCMQWMEKCPLPTSAGFGGRKGRECRGEGGRKGLQRNLVEMGVPVSSTLSMTMAGGAWGPNFTVCLGLGAAFVEC